MDINFNSNKAYSIFSKFILRETNKYQVHYVEQATWQVE